MKEIFETIFLLASIQGVLLSLMLFIREENHTANIYLSLGILALSSELFSTVYYSKGWYYSYPWFMGVTYSVAYLYGPVFYLYAKLLVKKIERVKIINLLHFIPFISGYFLLIPIYFLSTPEKIKFTEQMISGHKTLIYLIFGELIPVQGVIYTILTISLVSEYNKKIKERFSDIERINLDWLKYFTLAMIVCWSFSAASGLANLLVNKQTGFEIALHLAISVLIYSIGYLGLKQPEIFMRQPDDIITGQAAEKYRKSGLDDIEAEEIKKKLLDLMNCEKPYLDSGLTLIKLSEFISVSGHNLSEVINSRLGKSYYDFINEYRVEEFKKRLEHPSSKNYNLISVAFDSGFNSKTSFNTIFKKNTGQTPSGYRASLLKRNN